MRVILVEAGGRTFTECWGGGNTEGKPWGRAQKVRQKMRQNRGELQSGSRALPCYNDPIPHIDNTAGGGRISNASGSQSKGSIAEDRDSWCVRAAGSARQGGPFLQGTEHSGPNSHTVLCNRGSTQGSSASASVTCPRVLRQGSTFLMLLSSTWSQIESAFSLEFLYDSESWPYTPQGAPKNK
jgi:hypothetical protein